MADDLDIQFLGDVEPPAPEPPTPVEPVLLAIDVSGRDGVDGQDGYSPAGSASRGRDGQDGGNAGPAGRGEDAGEVELVLQRGRASNPGDSREARSSHVLLGGRRASPDGRTSVINEALSLGSEGLVQLLAVGGEGGDGGVGGDGQQGGRGSDGSSATRWRRGEDGGPGGDGGDGGNGTSGAPGGNGGQIAVQTSDDEMDLLMLVDYRVEPGEGGSVGRNGQGGAGGRGGDGGSSHSWTTTSHESYTDSEGKRQTRVVTHRHSNPGGSDGRRGSRGADGRAHLHHGASGEPGRFRIIVVDEHQRRAHYEQRYDLELQDYTLVLTDQFAEPGSAVELQQLAVRNSGGMPTPTRPVMIHLPSNPWVVPDDHSLELDRSLQPNSGHVFHTEKLTATITDVDEPSIGDPLNISTDVSPVAIQTGVNRQYHNFSLPKHFKVAFPSELTGLSSLVSQSPEQAARFDIEVVNVSQRDLGRESDGGRVLIVTLELLDPERADDVVLLELDGNVVSWDGGWTQEIPLLAAGERTTLSVVLGVLFGAPAYAKADLAVTLHIGDLKDVARARPRHRRDFRLRIGLDYEFDPTAEILFIANHGTTLDERKAWEQLAERFGKSINIWDISLNDRLSLGGHLRHGDSLLRDFHGKTIILSNAVFHTLLGQRHGDQFISQMDLIRALESHGMRMLVLNDDQHDVSSLLTERLIPTDGEPEYEYPSIGSFLHESQDIKADELLADLDEIVRRSDKAAGVNPLYQTSQITVRGIRSPNAKRLKRQAAKLQRELESQSPGKRFVVAYHLPGQLEIEEDPDADPPASGFFFEHGPQGRLTVMPTVGDVHPNIVVLPASNEDIHRPGFISGTAVTSGLVQTLGFREKLYLLDNVFRELNRLATIGDLSAEGLGPADEAELEHQTMLGEALVDGLLADLATELAAIAKDGWQGLLDSVVQDHLQQLKFLAEHPFELLGSAEERPESQLAARLLAGIEFLGRSQSRWYEARVFPWGWWRRGPVVRKLALRYQAQLAECLFGPGHQKQAQKLLAKHEVGLRRRWKQLRKLRRRVSKKQTAREVMFDHLQQHDMTTDAQTTFPRVLSHSQWSQVQSAESEREAKRNELREAKEQRRQAFMFVNEGKIVVDETAEGHAAAKTFAALCQQRSQSLAEHEIAHGSQSAATSSTQPIIVPETHDAEGDNADRVDDTRKTQKEW